MPAAISGIEVHVTSASLQSVWKSVSPTPRILATASIENRKTHVISLAKVAMSVVSLLDSSPEGVTSKKPISCEGVGRARNIHACSINLFVRENRYTHQKSSTASTDPATAMILTVSHTSCASFTASLASTRACR